MVINSGTDTLSYPVPDTAQQGLAQGKGKNERALPVTLLSGFLVCFVLYRVINLKVMLTRTVYREVGKPPCWNISSNHRIMAFALPSS